MSYVLLIVGSWEFDIYEDGFSRGLNKLGIDVIKFSTAKYFQSVFGKLQKRIPIIGPAQLRLNRELIMSVDSIKPDSVLFWRPTHILPSTLIYINQLSVATISYNNDDPFGPMVHGNVPWHHHWLWYWYLKCLPVFKLNFFYREINCVEAQSHGANHADTLLPYFLPWRDRNLELSLDEKRRFETDVVFCGHYEPDGRELVIKAIIKAGFKVKVWGGPEWNRDVLGDCFDLLSPITLANGTDYAKALSGAKMCLCFLSKLNRDSYTRRCFEIPAFHRVLLSERSEALESMYIENAEACYFSTPEEAVNRVRWLLDNPEERMRIANAGASRVWRDGGDVFSRAQEFLTKIGHKADLTVLSHSDIGIR